MTYTRSMDERLLPCPFCGNAPAYQHDINGVLWLRCVQCRIGIQPKWYDGDLGTTEASWNLRTQSEGAVRTEEVKDGWLKDDMKRASASVEKWKAASLPQHAQSGVVDDSFISEATAWAANMRLAAVCACNCGAKTHELSWHSVTCRFRALEEGAALLDEAALATPSIPAPVTYTR